MLGNVEPKGKAARPSYVEWGLACLLVLVGCFAVYCAVSALMKTPPKPKMEWPNTTAPVKEDKWAGGAMGINNLMYKKEEVSPGKWQWVIDRKSMAVTAKLETHRRNLYWALRSRVLTEKEMDEVTQYGDTLNIEQMVPYRAEEKMKELNDALLQQQRLRSAVRKVK